jgi:hypothetical protein
VPQNRQGAQPHYFTIDPHSHRRADGTKEWQVGRNELEVLNFLLLTKGSENVVHLFD